jgi:hypothetical protein
MMISLVSPAASFVGSPLTIRRRRAIPVTGQVVINDMKPRFTFGTTDSNANDRYWDVYLDGSQLEGCRATGETGEFTISVDSLASWDRMKSVRCGQFRNIDLIFAPAPPQFAPFVDGRGLRLYGDHSIGLSRLVVHLSIDVGAWTNPFPINAFIPAMKAATTATGRGCKWTEYSGASRHGFDFDIVMPISDPHATLGSTAGTAISIVREMTTAVSAQLAGVRSVPVSSVASLAPQSLSEDVHDDQSAQLPPPHGLVVFLCHAAEDKGNARDLYRRLLQDGFDPWLDEDNLLPGQEWETEIRRAVRQADIVVVCLSKRSIDKAGYVQREIRTALDAAEERPPGAIFVIPARIQQCQVPERLSRWQWVDLFEEKGYEQLCRALDLVRIRKG